MKLWVGVTDFDWFKFLKSRDADEVNFWQPSAARKFRVLEPGGLFLFKLHSPRNYVVGGGFFVRHSVLSCSLAWAAFGEKNGVVSMGEFRDRIAKYRRSDRLEADPSIGCNILAEPFFLDQQDWIPIPADWAPNIVQGKSYDMTQGVGLDLWNAVRTRLPLPADAREVQDETPRHGQEFLSRARLGQGAFRVLVTEAYDKRCAITGERTLPVLQASHIKPFALQGPNRVSNGLLLRSDLHILFDRGYLTVTPDLMIEVSSRIKEEFENGREYYAHHGKPLTVSPGAEIDRPKSEFLRWHNEHVFGGKKVGSNLL